MPVRLIVTRTGPDYFRVRTSASPKSVCLTHAPQRGLAATADLLGHVVTEWEPLGRLLAFFSASNEDRLNAAEALGITYREE